MNSLVDSRRIDARSYMRYSVLTGSWKFENASLKHGASQKREETRLQEHQRRLQLATVKTHREEIERIQDQVVGLEKDFELLSSYNTTSGNEVLIFELAEERSRLETRMNALAGERASTLGGFNDIAHIRQTIEKVETAINNTQKVETQREKLIQEIGSLRNQTKLLTETLPDIESVA